MYHVRIFNTKGTEVRSFMSHVPVTSTLERRWLSEWPAGYWIDIERIVDHYSDTFQSHEIEDELDFDFDLDPFIRELLE